MLAHAWSVSPFVVAFDLNELLKPSCDVGFIYSGTVVFVKKYSLAMRLRRKISDAAQLSLCRGDASPSAPQTT